MKWAVRIIATGVMIIATIVTVVFISLLAGPGATFELQTWEVVVDGSASIGLSYTTNEPLCFYLYGPKGEELDSAFPSEGATYVRLDMATLGTTPAGGSYRVVATDHFGEQVFAKSFSFAGAEIRIENVLTNWSYDEFFGWYVLENVCLEVTNSGDLPAYIDTVECLLEGEMFSGDLPSRWVKPNTIEALSWSEGIAYVEEPGYYELTFRVLDSGGETLAERAFLVAVP